MICVACGTSNSPQSQFCGSCGAALVEPCNVCGTLNPRSDIFCGNCGADRRPAATALDSRVGESVFAPVNLPRHLAKRLLESRAAIEGERKQITVLFADIKGSTSLIEDLDPEEADARLGPTLQAMIDAVHRYEGTINRIEGDGIMALFGAPLAHEDSAVRAAYAALDMQHAVRAASNAQPAIRVGLHAGEVVVRAIHTDLSVAYDAIGATVHLAARMEQMAEPGTIYCTTQVVRLAEGLIVTKSLGPVPVKGFREPLELFEIVDHTPARTRWEVTAARGLTRFIDRNDESAVLAEAMRTAAEGHGRLIGVVGEPGTGKTRLVYELLHSPEASNWAVLKTASASYTRNTPYLAFSNLIRTWCEIPDHASADDINRRLQAKISTFGEDLISALPAIRSLLDLPVDDAEWLALEPAARRQRIFAAAKRIILRGAEMRPLLLWFEDMQWTDAETRTLIEGLAKEVSNSRLLIIMTYRPEYRLNWPSDNYRTVQIEALDRPNAELLVRTLLGNDKANEPLCRLLVQRTEGTPLFIEETVRAQVERGVLRGGMGAYELTQELQSIKIPESVQAVLASRIDRLAPAQRELLQTASVIGSDIPIALLEQVAGIPHDKLRALLADLQAADFLYQVPNNASYQFRFKHALTHEVAYGSLLSRRRQELHGQVVRALESQHSENLAEVVENLAHHAMNAELWEDAQNYSRRAGDKAVELSAYREARVFYDQALEALRRLPQDRAHIQLGIDVRLGLRTIFGATADYSALEICLRDAEALAISIEDRPRLAAISIAQTLVHNWRGDLDASIECGERALGIAREINSSRLELPASFYLGQAYMWRGDFRRSLALLQNNQSWTTGPLRKERIGTTGTSSVLWMGMLAASHAYLGNFRDATAAAREACAIADEVNRPYDIALAYWYAGFVLSHQGNASSALASLEHGYQVCRAAQISFLIPVLSTSLGYTYAQLGRADEGIGLLSKALEFSQSVKFHYGVAWSTTYLGFAKLHAGRSEGVLEHAGHAMELASSHHYRAVEVTARRLMAEAYQRDGELELAEKFYDQSLDLASDLGLRPEQAHCQNGLAQIYLRSGRGDEATQLAKSATELYAALEMPVPPSRS
jgi:class 3 adenylate cyclase/tetratricopeptide (TPR) repeat protein